MSIDSLGRYKDRSWRKPPGHGMPTYEEAQLFALMDLRDELKLLNMKMIAAGMVLHRMDRRLTAFKKLTRRKKVQR